MAATYCNSKSAAIIMRFLGGGILGVGVMRFGCRITIVVRVDAVRLAIRIAMIMMWMMWVRW